MWHIKVKCKWGHWVWRLERSWFFAGIIPIQMKCACCLSTPTFHHCSLLIFCLKKLICICHQCAFLMSGFHWVCRVGRSKILEGEGRQRSGFVSLVSHWNDSSRNQSPEITTLPKVTSTWLSSGTHELSLPLGLVVIPPNSYNSKPR